MEQLSDRQCWLKLTAVQTGGAICLPIFIIGHALAQNYGLASAILAIICGNLLLMCMGLVLAWTSAHHRKSTAECAVEVFGKSGKSFFPAAMVISMIGWFAIQLNIMTISLSGFIPVESSVLCNLGLGIIITLFGLRGMNGLETLSRISMPVLILTIGYAVFKAGNKEPLGLENNVLTISGISLVTAAAIAAVVDVPTFFRHAKSQKDAFVAIIALFGFVLPAIEGVGVYLSIHSFGNDIVKVLMSAEPSIVWTLWIAAFLILAGWTTNNANLYSAAVSMKTIFPRLKQSTGILILGAAGTVLSCFNFLDNLEQFLDLVGIVLGAMGAVMIMHYFFRCDSKRNYSLISWMIGMAAGMGAKAGFSITVIPVLDAFFAGLIIMGGFNAVFLFKNPIQFEEYT
jgi:cytosine permease